MNPTETHIHIANLNTCKLPTAEEIKSILPENEFSSTQNFISEDLKNTALLTKILTRTILAKYLNLDPKEIPIIRKDLEKPKLSPPFNHFDFNISHTKTYFALAITKDAMIGIDTENLDKKNDILSIAKRFFHPDEYSILMRSDNKPDMFFRIWTQKEAFVKAIGEGLSFGIEKFIVDPIHAKIITINDPRYKAQEFHTRLIKLPEQHYLCITATKNLDDLSIINI